MVSPWDGVGKVDQAPGRWAVGHRPRCVAEFGAEVVRYFVATGGGEGADVEQPVQRFLPPSGWSRVSVYTAPAPLGRVATQGGLELGHAGLPGDLDRVGAGLFLRCIAVIPPRRIRAGGQAWQSRIDHAGAQHGVKKASPNLSRMPNYLYTGTDIQMNLPFVAWKFDPEVVR